jgi:hypothetical protein
MEAQQLDPAGRETMEWGGQQTAVRGLSHPGRTLQETDWDMT